jgi:hypothetical protein
MNDLSSKRDARLIGLLGKISPQKKPCQDFTLQGVPKDRAPDMFTNGMSDGASPQKNPYPKVEPEVGVIIP